MLHRRRPPFEPIHTQSVGIFRRCRKRFRMRCPSVGRKSPDAMRGSSLTALEAWWGLRRTRKKTNRGPLRGNEWEKVRIANLCHFGLPQHDLGEIVKKQALALLSRRFRDDRARRSDSVKSPMTQMQHERLPGSESLKELRAQQSGRPCGSLLHATVLLRASAMFQRTLPTLSTAAKAGCADDANLPSPPTWSHPRSMCLQAVRGQDL